MLSKLIRKIDRISALQLFQLMRYAVFILLGILFAKAGLAKSSLAKMETLIFLSGLFSYFWVNSFVQVLLSEYPTFNDIEKSYVFFRYFLFFQFLSVLSAFGIVLLTHGEYKIIIASYVLFHTPGLLNEYVLFLKGKRTLLISYGFVNAILHLFIALCFVLYHQVIFHLSLDDSFPFFLISLTLVALLRWCFTLYLLSKYARFDKGFFKKMDWKTILVLVFSFLLSGSSEYISGWFVTNFGTASDFTTFRYGTKEMPLFTLLAATLSNSMITEIVQKKSKGISLLREKCLMQMHLFFPIAILLALTAPYLFNTFFSPEFYISGKLFSITMLLTIPRMLFPQPIIHAFKSQSYLNISLVFEIVALVICSFVGYHFWGLIGLAIAIVLAYTLEKFILVLIVKSKFGIPLSDYLPLNWFLIYSISLFIAVVCTILFS